MLDSATEVVIWTYSMDVLKFEFELSDGQKNSNLGACTGGSSKEEIRRSSAVEDPPTMTVPIVFFYPVYP